MTEQNHSDRGHTRVSPSGLKMLAQCPGFMSDPVWNNHPNTLLGTFLHECLDNDTYDEVEEEHMPWIEMCHDAMICCRHEAMMTDIEYVEHKEPELDVVPGIKGHVDWVMIQGKKAWMLDWKFGANKVEEAEHNHQGKAYALGVFKKFGVESVKVGFIQPRIPFETYHTFTVEDIPEIEEEIEYINRTVADVDNGNHDRFDMSSGICRLCIRADCHLRAGKALTVAKQIDDTIVSFDTTALAKPDVMAKACDLIPMLEQFIKAVKSKRLEMIANGEVIPGYQLTTQSGGNEVVDNYRIGRMALEYVDQASLELSMKLDLTALIDVIYQNATKDKKKTKEEFVQKLLQAGAIKPKPRKNIVKKIKI